MSSMDVTRFSVKDIADPETIRERAIEAMDAVTGEEMARRLRANTACPGWSVGEVVDRG